MTYRQDTPDPRWWYATVTMFLCFTATAVLTVLDSSIALLQLTMILSLIILVPLFIDIRAVKKSQINWNPNWVYYVVGSAIFLVPILPIYAYRRYQVLPSQLRTS